MLSIWIWNFWVSAVSYPKKRQRKGKYDNFCAAFCMPTQAISCYYHFHFILASIWETFSLDEIHDNVKNNNNEWMKTICNNAYKKKTSLHLRSLSFFGRLTLFRAFSVHCTAAAHIKCRPLWFSPICREYFECINFQFWVGSMYELAECPAPQSTVHATNAVAYKLQGNDFLFGFIARACRLWPAI